MHTTSIPQVQQRLYVGHTRSISLREILPYYGPAALIILPVKSPVI